ncbi:MAG: hypothetical protein K2I30_02295 [Clostridia bacterium]|nr:hypothetical protein [Clostridia bacterium]
MIKRSDKLVKKLAVVVYWSLLIILLGLFFSNDFGLVDIHKTSIIVAVGVDVEDGEVQVTAQIAVPQPSENGDSIQYTQVQGSGFTVADALNEINAKTGYYPKLLFCKLILIGEECQKEELFKVLSCFYRRNYSELTALVAMCEGKASDMLSKTASLNSETTEAIRQVLSDELKKSANVSSVNLKDIAEAGFSVSKACYMPYIEANKQGTSENGGGDSVGGESSESGGNGESGGGSSGGGSGGSSGEGGQGGSGGGSTSGQSGQSGAGGDEPLEFTARRTAIFSDGKFKGMLDETQSFALDIINNDIRLAVLPFDHEGTSYTLGLKNADGGVKLKVKEGKPTLTVSFKAKAQVQGVKKAIVPKDVSNDDVVSAEVLKSAEKEVEERFANLLNTCRETDCDLLAVKSLLHKYNHKYYDAFKDDILTRMEIKYEIDIQSMN